MSRNKSQIDQINPVCGQRLRQLLNEFKITQKDFAITVNQDPSYICRLINSRQRLSPDTARFYIKAAFDGKGIRWEWLAGWDDFKTDAEKVENDIYVQGNIILKESNEWRQRDEAVSKILRAMSYRLFEPYVSAEFIRTEEEAVEFSEFFDMIHNAEKKQMMKEKFSESGLREIRMLCDKKLRENDAVFMDLFGDDREDDEEYSEHWVVNHAAEYLESIKAHAQREQEERENTSWGLYDDNQNMVMVFSPNEYITFVNQLYDVVTALIQYHIGKKKGQS